MSIFKVCFTLLLFLKCYHLMVLHVYYIVYVFHIHGCWNFCWFCLEISVVFQDNYMSLSNFVQGVLFLHLDVHVYSTSIPILCFDVTSIPDEISITTM